MHPRPIHVLVVDDSAVVRQTTAAILSREENVTVAVAADPLIAMSRMKEMRPDVILLDLEMPRMDGMSFLRKVMREDPIPVVICSALTGNGTVAAIKALEEGALAIVTKPKLGVRQFLEESAVMLVDAVRGASRARLRPARSAVIAPRSSPDSGQPRTRPVPARGGRDVIVAIGASTGGPDALRLVLEAMPADSPPILIVQHMPAGFTRAFADRLDQTCALDVREAADGDRVLPGTALIAAGDRHMIVHGRGAARFVEVGGGSLVSRHRPSVDVLFRSVAQAAGADAIGVLMTGMGGDGASGLLEMRNAGATTIAQDEATCVVFGMPREAIALGAASRVVPLEGIAPLIADCLASR